VSIFAKRRCGVALVCGVSHVPCLLHGEDNSMEPSEVYLIALELAWPPVDGVRCDCVGLPGSGVPAEGVDLVTVLQYSLQTPFLIEVFLVVNVKWMMAVASWWYGGC